MAYCNTIFNSMLNFIPRHQFSALEKHHGTGRKSRTFSRWNQYVHLMFMQLTGRSSLRDGIQSMNSRAKSLYRMGAKPVPRSAFADANNTLLDHSGYLPAFVSITDGKTHESRAAKSISLTKGSIVVEDRAYTDCKWFSKLHENGIFFITRQKSNAVYRVVERRVVNKKQGLCSDQTIVPTGIKGRQYPYPLRRVGYRDPETKKHYVFITNNFKLSAKTVAGICKKRWQIEIFFRWIKQNLKIKAFIGNSRNAVMTQIYVALIAYLLLCMFKYLSKIPASLRNLLRVIQINLFRRCTLEELFKPPPKPDNEHKINRQLSLAFI